MQHLEFCLQVFIFLNTPFPRKDSWLFFSPIASKSRSKFPSSCFCSVQFVTCSSLLSVFSFNLKPNVFPLNQSPSCLLHILRPAAHDILPPLMLKCKTVDVSASITPVTCLYFCSCTGTFAFGGCQDLAAAPGCQRGHRGGQVADGGAQHPDESLQQPHQQPVQPGRHVLAGLLEQPAGPQRQAGQHLHRQLPGHPGRRHGRVLPLELRVGHLLLRHTAGF